MLYGKIFFMKNGKGYGATHSGHWTERSEEEADR